MSDRELTLPSSDTHAARRHLGAALVRLVPDLQRAPLPSEPIAAADARAVLALVGPLSRAQPGVVWAALRRPSVYTHLRLAADRHPDPAVLLTGLTTFAAELAASGALGEPLVIQRPPPRLLLRSRLEEVRPSPEAPPRLERSGALLQRGSPCPRRAGFLPISHGLALALADDNPLASVEAHPDKSGSGLDLGEAPAERWLASPRRVWRWSNAPCRCRGRSSSWFSRRSCPSVPTTSATCRPPTERRSAGRDRHGQRRRPRAAREIRSSDPARSRVVARAAGAPRGVCVLGLTPCGHG